MNATPQQETDKIPGTVFSSRQVRMLKVAVIVMGVALVGGFALVLGTIVYQASNIGKSALSSVPDTALATVPAAAGIALKQGESISHLALDGNRLAVHVSGPAGAEIRIYDLRAGAVIARVRVEPE